MSARNCWFLLVVLALAGCTSMSGVKWWSPKTYFSGSEARTEVKALASVDVKREAVLRAGQASVYETVFALMAAGQSRAAALALDAAQSAQGLLDQALGVLPVDETARLRARVAALLSENETIRGQAEKERNAARSLAAEQGKELDEARKALAEAQAALSTAFARENATANAYRNEQAKSLMWKLGLGSLALVVAAGWVYVRFFAGGIPAVLGNMLARADVEQPNKAEDMREMLNKFLNRDEQAKVAKHAAKTALKIKSA